MLKSLSIRNFVLIDKLDIDFNQGFSVLSGETGAGKSILLEALGLLTGQRADPSMIRNGCDKMSVCGVFELTDVPEMLRQVFNAHDLEVSSEIIIKRTLDINGKGKIFVNDEPVTQKLLREIGRFLIEIHGQFDNQGLLDSENHLKILDSYGKYKLNIVEMRKSFDEYKKADKEFENLYNENKRLQEQKENLEAWVAEFEKIAPQEEEIEKLEIKRRQLMNGEKILENLNAAHQVLSNSEKNVCSSLRSAQTAIARLNALTDNAYENIYNLLDAALINAQEAQAEIEIASEEISFNQDEINKLESRLFSLKNLARKHNVLPEELVITWEKMSADLKNLEDISENLHKAEQKTVLARSQYEKYAKDVSKQRHNYAKILSENVMKELPDLKLEKATFIVSITEKKQDLWNEDGIDEVKFLVSTNPGMPAEPINKIASGGELARFMLALKVNLLDTEQVETMIFDEVDAGVGGATAQAVGEKLSALGRKVQVFVVTHSPQVAALSQNHYRVEKRIENSQTYTKIKQLTEEEKQEEIARMLSGEKISEEARAAAKVLIGA